jgi:hypothetical protein
LNVKDILGRFALRLDLLLREQQSVPFPVGLDLETG